MLSLRLARIRLRPCACHAFASPPFGADATGRIFRRTVGDLVKARKEEARLRRIREGRSALGVRKILAQSPFACPKSHAPHFKMNPRLATKNKWLRIEALLRNRRFQEKYREAIERHIAVVANVLFPFGSYWMKKFGKVFCETDKAGAPSALGQPAPTPA
jgi:putative transposase